MTEKISSTEEMTIVLVSKETKNLVKELFINNNEILAFEKYNMNFRLYRSCEENINLEVIVINYELGCVYTKPIGFYKKDGEIIILKEYESDLLNLQKKGIIPKEKKIVELSLTANAIIACFSIEALNYSQKMRDISFSSNGLDLDIFLTNEGGSQGFLDDKYNFDGPISFYDMGGDNPSVAPRVKYKELYDILLEKKLLTMFNRI